MLNIISIIIIIIVVVVLRCIRAHSALEILRNALHKCSSCLLTYKLCTVYRFITPSSPIDDI